jgi:hypothetical protein
MLLDPFEPISLYHDLASFDAGSDEAGIEQTTWLKTMALRSDRVNFTRVFVACFAGTTNVGAYFSLATATIKREDLPRALPRADRPHGTPSVIPAVLLARLAVHTELQGQNIGTLTVIAALDEATKALGHVAFRVIVVDPMGEKAPRLYTKHFSFRALQNADLPNRLFVFSHDAAALLGSA